MFLEQWLSEWCQNYLGLIKNHAAKVTNPAFGWMRYNFCLSLGLLAQVYIYKDLIIEAYTLIKQ